MKQHTVWAYTHTHTQITLRMKRVAGHVTNAVEMNIKFWSRTPKRPHPYTGV